MAIDPATRVVEVRGRGIDQSAIYALLSSESVSGVHRVLPLEGTELSVEKSSRVESSLLAMDGVLDASVDVERRELVVIYDPDRTEVKAVRRLIGAHGWVAADPIAAGTERQKSAGFVWRVLIAVAGATAASIAALSTDGAIAPLASMLQREADRSLLELSPRLAHALLATITIASVALLPLPIFRGAFRDIVRGAATTRLLGMLSVLLLLASSIAGSILRIDGSDAPLLYATTAWTLAVLLGSAALDAARVRRQRTLPRGTPTMVVNASIERKAGSAALRWGTAVLVAAIAVAAVWLARGSLYWAQAALATGSVLMVAAISPFARVFTAFSGRAIRSLAGEEIDVAGLEVLERADAIDELVITARGGIAPGTMSVDGHVLLDGTTSDELFATALAASQGQDPRIAAALRDRTPASGNRSLVEARLGSREGFQDLISGLEVIEPEVERFENEGKTVLLVASGSRLIGAIALKLPIRESIHEGIERLHHLGIATTLATGAAEGTAAALATSSGTRRYAANLDDLAKARLISSMRDAGHRVALASNGDDTRACARADLDIRFPAGESSPGDAELRSGDGKSIARFFELAQWACRGARSRMSVLALYHLLAIPLAAGVLTPMVQLVPSPFVAGLASMLVGAAVSRAPRPPEQKKA